MCGRGTQNYSWDEVRHFLNLIPTRAPNLEPRDNIAPTTMIDVAREGATGRALVKMRWDFIPGWWKKPLKEKKFTSFNARVETLREAPVFRTAWRRGQRQRCIVPMNFFEWRRSKKKGQAPVYIYPKGGALFSDGGNLG